ncbi:MAG TPA: alcohol dehydrogenase catalytic domain-containing protein [Anaerolineae bacterium]|nr:alcohol dehydrogenase catalytic domain-containing protein [Anaerolineae bacterium]
MKAIVCTAYGPPEVLQLQEVDKPVPRGNEVLIKVCATTVHRGDSRMRGLDIPGPGWQRLLARLVLGIRRPRKAILGMELAGEIEALGQDVTRFKRGDRVFASTAWSGFGAYAEYKSMTQDGALALMPAHMTFEEAAVIPSGGHRSTLSVGADRRGSPVCRSGPQEGKRRHHGGARGPVPVARLSIVVPERALASADEHPL